MPVITCPDCGMVTDIPVVNRTSEEFCVKCDFPLFWAALGFGDNYVSDTDANLRRLPGSGGRRTLGTRSCPHCGELNELIASHCIRCHGELDPKEVELPGYAATPPEYESDESNEWKWAAILLAVLVVILAVLLVLVLVL